MKSELAQKILALLQENARITDAELGDRLGIPAAQAAERISALEKNGTIRGYHAVVDDALLGDGAVRAIIEVEVQPERDGGFDRAARMISKFDEVLSVFLISGRYDLRLEVSGKSLQEVAFFVASKLAPLKGVRSTATHFLLKKYKESGFVLDKDEEYERLKISP